MQQNYSMQQRLRRKSLQHDIILSDLVGSGNARKTQHQDKLLCHKLEACMNFNEIPFQTKGQFGIAMADEINCRLKEKIARCLVD